MKEKMTKKQIAQRPKDFTHNKYEHCGSRMFINGESGDRQLIVDTYFVSLGRIKIVSMRRARIFAWIAIALIYIVFFSLIGWAVHYTQSLNPLWALVLTPFITPHTSLE